MSANQRPQFIRICIGIAGFFIAVYSLEAPFVWLGGARTEREQLFILYVLCSIPAFLLVFWSFFWATLVILSHWVLGWVAFTNPFDSVGGILEFASILLVGTALLIAISPSDGSAFRKMSDLRAGGAPL
jgi:hypothetical protein